MFAALLGLGLLIAPPQGAASAAASLVGSVREAGSRASIPNARVILAGSGVLKTVTADSQGRFAFADLPPGRYGLLAEMEGFAFDRSSAPGAILVAGRSTMVDLEMSRAAVIAGEVRDERGDPRSGISITVIRRAKAGGTEMWPQDAALTDARGGFRVDGLLPGEYLVLASPADKRTPDVAIMPTYYPSVTDQKSATTIALVPGQTATGINVTMQSTAAYEITGTVVDEEGRPVRAMIAFVSQSVQTWVPNQSAGLRVSISALTTRADGTFRIAGLGSGSYRLTPLPAPEAPSQQLPPEVTAAAVNGNRSTLQVDVHDASVNGVTIVFRASPR
jgi:hypothetical protein